MTGKLGPSSSGLYNLLGRLVPGERRLAGKLKGEVVAVADSGNLVTDISADQLADVPRDESVTIKCDGHATSGIFPADHDQPPFTFLAMLSEAGLLELCMVGESASKFLGIKPGSSITVAW